MTEQVCVIEGFNGRGIFGWVRRPADGSVLRVDIAMDGQVIATDVPVDRVRDDRTDTRKGGERRGFAWELSPAVTFGDQVKIDIRMSGSDDPIAQREFRAPFSPKPWRGAIRTPKNRTVSGWVKKNGSHDAIVADVYLDDHLVQAGVMCDALVPELATEGSSAGYWGFSVTAGDFRPSSETVLIALRDPDDGRTIVERSVDAAAFTDSYRGRLELSERADVRGWAVNENATDDVFDVEILLDGHPYITTRTSLLRGDLRDAGLSNGRGGLSFANPVPRWLSDGVEHTLSLRYPDGTTSSDYRYAAPPRSSDGSSVRFGGQNARGVTVIVPIYNAPDDLTVCIDRLLAYTPDSARILLIDDCSPDPRVREILDRHRDSARIRILSNDENLGFTRTVNRGIDEACDDDVILLNSDARVTPGWLEGMLAAAADSPRTATVTAMSDRAGAFSAPRIGNDNPLPAGVDEITFARAFRRESVRAYPRVPTGNGFCMWISRRCIEQIGSLDADAFPRGYGEENDFCMRAGRAGWIHVIDDSTYVFHDRSKSFGDTKSELLAAGRAVVDARYPEYKNAIRVFRESPEIAIARNRAFVAMDTASSGTALPRVLYVISTTTGGTPQTNADLMNALDDTVEPWVLRCDSRVMTLSRVGSDGLHEVRAHHLRHELEPVGHFSPEYDGVISAWLAEYGFEIVHIRHLLWHSLSLPGIASRLGMKVVISFHDYYALSPNLKLIDDQGEFLGDDFVASGSVYRDSGWAVQSYPTPTGEWLQWWQDRFWGAIRMSDAFVTTSESARELILYHFPDMNPDRFHVIEHGRNFEVFRSVAARPVYGEPIRILVPGGINAAKGAEILRSLADADVLGEIEWHILGPIRQEFESAGSRVVYHGAYKREDFGRLVEEIAPHAGAVLSIWDETYCHTLTEMWSVGLPAFVLDYPNVAQRVRRFNAGWVLTGRDAPSLASQITEAVYDVPGRVAALLGVHDWQTGWGSAWTTKQMALRYLDIYRSVLGVADAGDRRAHRVGVLARSPRERTTDAVFAYDGLGERTRNSMDREITFAPVTPEGAIASMREGLVDALIVQRDALPPAAAKEVSATAAAAGVPLIVGDDGDVVSDHASDRGVARAEAWSSLVGAATALSVPTAVHGHERAGSGVPTEVFSAALSDRLWHVSTAARVRDDKLRALFFSARASSGDLDVALPALDEFAASRPDFELVVIGDAADDDLQALRDGRPWLTVMSVPETVQGFPDAVKWLREHSVRIDFAIAPRARVGTSDYWSDLTLLEHVALGIRTIASAGASEVPESVPGVTRVENTPPVWLDALRRTASDVTDNGSRVDARDWLVSQGAVRSQRHRFDRLVLDAMRSVPDPSSAAVAH